MTTKLRDAELLFVVGLTAVLAACTPQPDDELLAEKQPGIEPPGLAAANVRDVAETWALYTVPVGAHGATLQFNRPGNPLALFTTTAGRDYLFRFNASAMYVLTRPTDPSDQFDWNKLPGLSDCGTLDLSVNGAMFGWRWRLDLSPRVLEITAYANNNGTHLWSDMPLFTLDAADLAGDVPLRYRVWLDGSYYRFAVSGSVRGRTIDVTTTLPRACPATGKNGLKWASGLYFGGTSVAPTAITGWVSESPFVP